MADKQKEKKKEPVRLTSKKIYNNTLYEQVYNPKTKKTYFLGWDKEKQETIPIDYIMNGIKHLPIFDDMLHKKVVILPSEAIDYGTIQDLELEIECFIKTWLDISKEHLRKATWYVILTWVTDKLKTIPYLRALGDYGTGKTRYLDVIGGICYKPMFVGGSVRAAPIYRVIDKWRGTAIFDEFTLTKSDETEDIIQILNNGYQREKPVLRCDQGSFKVRAFDPFGAKILATRKRFNDKALESRCITEIMQLTDRNDIPVDLTSEFHGKKMELQNKLLMYRFKNWDEINPDLSVTIDFGNVLPRIKQSFTPFTVLFQHDNEMLTEFIRYTQLYNQSIIRENADSFDGQILNAYLKLLEKHEMEQQTLDDYHDPTITSTDIKNYLVEDGWNEDKLKTSTIGRHLKILGFETSHKFIAGKTRRVLEIGDKELKRLRKRYDITVITDITEHTEPLKNNNNNENREGCDA